jgi:hypothetical protein
VVGKTIRGYWLWPALLLALALLLAFGERVWSGAKARTRARASAGDAGAGDASVRTGLYQPASPASALAAVRVARRPPRAALMPALPVATGSGPATREQARATSLGALSRWHAPSCGDADAAKVAEARGRYLSTFRGVTETLRAHADSAEADVEVVRQQIERLQMAADSRLGIAAPLPATYLYPTVEALREHSCTSQRALAYYDGAIHLAREGRFDGGLRASLSHEYAHHVLVSHGVTGPFWLQEGTAMAFASDVPGGYWSSWRKSPLPLADMVDGPARGSSPHVTTAFHAQAAIMIELLERLCLNRSGCNTAELVAALESSAATPESLFAWALARRGSDLFRSTRLSLWDDYVQHGDFPPATKEALLARTKIVP